MEEKKEPAPLYLDICTAFRTDQKNWCSNSFKLNNKYVDAFTK